MLSKHPEEIPLGWTPARYFYSLQTGKKDNKCIVCDHLTDWNEATLKYNRFCNNPNCKKEYRKQFEGRMISRYGKVTLLDDPDQQRMMLLKKKNTGLYKFRDGGEIEYVSTYELDFLKMLDNFLKIPSADILGPSPHTYYYDYKNQNDDQSNWGRKFYIPDYYIPSLNLEVEIKQNTSTHPDIIRVNKVKEKLKDEVMKNVPGIRYIKITDKDYTEFFRLILSLKEMYASKNNGESIATESYRGADLYNYIDNLQRTLMKYDYGYRLNDTLIKPSDGDSFDIAYKTMPPSFFQRARAGVCYDFSNYMYEVMKNREIPVKQYLIVLKIKNEVITHSFVITKSYSSYVYPESALGDIMGTWVAKSEKDIISFILKNLGYLSSTKAQVYEIPDSLQKKLEFLTAPAYIKRVEEHGKKLDFYYKKKYKVHSLEEHYRNPIVDEE